MHERFKTKTKHRKKNKKRKRKRREKSKVKQLIAILSSIRLIELNERKYMKILNSKKKIYVIKLM